MKNSSDRTRCRWGLAALIGLALAMTGCLNPAPGQKAWHDRLGTAVSAVYESDSREAPRVRTVNELRELAGSPDLVLSAVAFEAALTGPLERRQWVMSALRLAVAQRSRARAKSRATGVATGQQSSDGLSTCSVWVYEENRHFPRPMPAWGWSPGFMCYVFVTRDDMVIGARQFMIWASLQPTNE